MNIYTIDSLLPHNTSFHAEHFLTSEDVNIVNHLVLLVESSRSSLLPMPGDCVHYTDRQGRTYKDAHLESTEDRMCSICLGPMTPFVFERKDSGIIYCNTSGGPWINIPLNGLKKSFSRTKKLKSWGHCGACKNGTVQFEATVNTWVFDELDREFSCGCCTISRRELESWPCPFYTRNVTDQQMQQIVNETDHCIRERWGFSSTETYDPDDEKISETWLEELEAAILRQNVPYYEDLDDNK